MAVTLRTSPQAYTPAFNPQWFTATSNQTGSANFRYRVVFTDLLTSESVTKDIDQDENGWCKFDAGGFSEQYITQLCPSNLFGFQQNTGALRKIRVNIGEVYGSTPTYYAGSNTDYYIWNGALDDLEFQDYDYTDYVYDRGSSRLRFLMGGASSGYTYGSTAAAAAYMKQDKTYQDRSNYIYALTAQPGTYNNFEEIQIVGYDESGNTLSTTNIGNPYASGAGSYINKYVFIDVGYEGLEGMPAWQVVSGTYPIPVSTFAYYDIRDVNNGVGGGAQSALIKRIYVECEPRYDVIGVHYLGRQGQFDNQMCAKLSLRTMNNDKKFYSKLPYYTSGYNVVYDYSFASEQTLSSTAKNRLTVNTDWLEDWEVTKLKDAVSSPIVYADLGDANGLIAVKMITSTYEEKKKYNSQLRSVSFDLEYAHINVRQKT
jgi:hypothetical protein